MKRGLKMVCKKHSVKIVDCDDCLDEMIEYFEKHDIRKINN